MRTTDVSHGVGVYDPDKVMIKQVNVAPGVTQEFLITINPLRLPTVTGSPVNPIAVF